MSCEKAFEVTAVQDQLVPEKLAARLTIWPALCNFLQMLQVLICGRAPSGVAI